MKIIDGHELCKKILDFGLKKKSPEMMVISGMIEGIVNELPEAEAYTECKKRIENMEKIIENQQERIDIMAEGKPWVEVGERLPREGIDCFVAFDSRFGKKSTLAYLVSGAWLAEDGSTLNKVTHWQYADIPEPPKEVIPDADASDQA